MSGTPRTSSGLIFPIEIRGHRDSDCLCVRSKSIRKNGSFEYIQGHFCQAPTSIVMESPRLVPRNAGFSSRHSSPYRSPRDEKAVFTRPSLHRKIPFLTRVSETGSMTGLAVGSSVSPTKPQIPAPTPDRPFLWEFSPVFFYSFGLRVTLAASQADFWPPVAAAKIPFPAAGFGGQYRSGAGEYWRSSGQKRRFEPGP
jgi:hypothetical protein